MKVPVGIGTIVGIIAAVLSAVTALFAQGEAVEITAIVLAVMSALGTSLGRMWQAGKAEELI